MTFSGKQNPIEKPPSLPTVVYMRCSWKLTLPRPARAISLLVRFSVIVKIRYTVKKTHKYVSYLIILG